MTLTPTGPLGLLPGSRSIRVHVTGSSHFLVDNPVGGSPFWVVFQLVGHGLPVIFAGFQHVEKDTTNHQD